MESVTDPEKIKHRTFFKLGLFTYDYRKGVLVVGILSCLMMGSLISLGPDWAESWGEGDLESVEALDLIDQSFSDGEEEVQSFVFLVHHDELDDSSEVWQKAVTDALAQISKSKHVTIN